MGGNTIMMQSGISENPTIYSIKHGAFVNISVSVSRKSVITQRV